jgi:hypothetical protein
MFTSYARGRGGIEWETTSSHLVLDKRITRSFPWQDHMPTHTLARRIRRATVSTLRVIRLFRRRSRSLEDRFACDQVISTRCRAWATALRTWQADFRHGERGGCRLCPQPRLRKKSSAAAISDPRLRIGTPGGRPRLFADVIHRCKRGVTDLSLSHGRKPAPRTHDCSRLTPCRFSIGAKCTHPIGHSFGSFHGRDLVGALKHHSGNSAEGSF